MAPTPLLSITEHVPSTEAADGRLVVLVHGSLDRAASFARVTRRLREIHTVAYDRRGYHRSRDVGPVHTSIAGHVDDLLAVVDDRPSVMVGHSYGGVIALGAALRQDDSGPIRAVAAYEPPLPWLGPWATRNGSPSGGSRRPDPGDPGAVAEHFFRRMVGDTAWERLPEHTKEARRADGAALAAELAAVRTTEAPFDVTAITVPVVFGRGSDSLPHHRATVGWLVEHVPGSHLVEIEGAGHGAHLTHPDAFADFVRTGLGLARW